MNLDGLFWPTAILNPQSSRLNMAVGQNTNSATAKIAFWVYTEVILVQFLDSFTLRGI